MSLNTIILFCRHISCNIKKQLKLSKNVAILKHSKYMYTVIYTVADIN